MLIIDSREKPKAITRILDYCQNNGIKYMTSKLIVGDYMMFNNPGIIVDRKQNVAELAKNCTSDKTRFLAEIQTAQNLGVELVILVEQDKYQDRGKTVVIRDISDLLTWSNPYSTIRGETIYRTLAYWTNKYPFRVEFCRKADTGKRIIEILEGQN